MRKYFPHISAFIFTLVLVFAVSGFVFPQTAHAAWYNPFSWINIADFASDVFLSPLGWLAILILQLAALITHLSGTILNYVVQFTVVDMAKNISKAGAINDAWKVIRDVANMSFIFVLLYAAIRTILGIGSDVKKLIVNIIVVAILINFSLFFTKVVIDASNILAITFYDSIAPTALSSTASAGLSGSLMEPLRIQSLWKITTDTFEGKKLIIIGVMGTIVSLIAAFVFFAVAIMFVIRFVILIFILILSPLAFMGFILPQLKQYKDQWLDALLGQAFFAPIYFMLTWIVIIVSRGLLTTTTTGGDMATAFTGVVGVDGNVTSPTPESITLLMNYIIMIVFLIASLIIAKKWADKAGHGVPGLTKWATGAAGGATFGMVARGGRNIIGSRAAAMANDDELKKKAAEGNVRARLQLAMANKTAKSSFDLRGAPGGGSLEAGSAKKGGFIQDQKDRAKAYDKYKPSKDDKDEAATETAETRNELNTARKTAVEGAKTAVLKPAELTEAERQLEEARDMATRPPLEGLSETDIASSKARREAAVAEAEQRVKQEKGKHNKAVQSYIDNRITTEQRTYEEALGVEHEMTNRMENMAKRAEDQTIRGKIPFIKKRVGFTVPKFVPTSVAVSGKDKAQAIRAASKGKSNAEKLLEDVEKKIKDEKESETPPTTPPPAPVTPPPTP